MSLDWARRTVTRIEDNADPAEMLRDLLVASGHSVSVASNGASALELLHAQPFDAILCDLGLRGMSGYELARLIRSEQAHRRTPLLAVTGYSQREDRKRSAEAGVDGHLVKPVTLQTIEAMLSQLVARNEPEPVGAARPQD